MLLSIGLILPGFMMGVLARMIIGNIHAEMVKAAESRSATHLFMNVLLP